MPSKLEAAAKELVDRSRLGDQNAMALISAARKASKRGNAKAKEACAAIFRYVEANPVEAPPVAIGAESVARLSAIKEHGSVIALRDLLMLPLGGEDALLAGAVVLANGPPLTKEQITAMGTGIPNEEECKLFYYAIQNCGKALNELARVLPKKARCIMYAGQCVGMAHNIQRVRDPGIPVSAFSPMAGWELGE